MKKIVLALIPALVIAGSCSKDGNKNYPHNRPPLASNAYIPLPAGSVKPLGWLHDQLRLQADGLTGNLDEFWPDLVNSSWRGGSGEAWERGPYYLDGLVPLAYLLDDEMLKNKVKEWIEPIIASSTDSGWYGPAKNRDRWPLAVANKVLMQYYEATSDERALNVLLNYFRYLHESPPDWPDKDWRGVRAMENAVTGYKLFRYTGEEWILETIRSIQENSSDWTTYYEKFPWDSAASAEKRIPLNWNADGLTAHVVNNAMAIKYPGLWYQQSKDERFRKAVFEGISKYDLNHGQAGGRFSGDEHLSGKSPDRGTELCSVVEYMFSLGELFGIFGDVGLADRLELLTFNALPGTTTPDMWAHQYDQQSNQVMVDSSKRAWSTNRNFSNIYGLMPNFACCLANMHQGWPKFTSSLWMATNDNGLVATAYSPSIVSAKVADGKEVTVTEITEYPFRGDVTLKINLAEAVRFPVYLRIPGWSDTISFYFRGKTVQGAPGTMVRINERWNDNDEIKFTIPLNIRTEKRYNNAVAVLKGPLYFALRIAKEYKPVKINYDNFGYKGSIDWQIRPLSDWNYGVILDMERQLRAAETIENPLTDHPFADAGDMVWSQEDARYSVWEKDPPVVIKTRGVRIPAWQMHENSAAIPPPSPVAANGLPEEIELVPYGCTRLRITEFPVIDVRFLRELMRPASN